MENQHGYSAPLCLSGCYYHICPPPPPERVVRAPQHTLSPLLPSLLWVCKGLRDPQVFMSPSPESLLANQADTRCKAEYPGSQAKVDVLFFGHRHSNTLDCPRPTSPRTHSPGRLPCRVGSITGQSCLSRSPETGPAPKAKVREAEDSEQGSLPAQTGGEVRGVPPCLRWGHLSGRHRPQNLRLLMRLLRSCLSWKITKRN